MPLASSALLAANSFENVGRVIVGLLAVGGAFLVGSVLTWLILKLVARFALRKTLPLWFVRLGRVAGGVLLAFVVALFVFGEGGMGWGPGSAQKGDQGPGSEPKQEPDVVPPRPPKEDPLKNKLDDGPARDSVRVVILGGGALEEKFYLFQSDPTPRTLTELRQLILDLREKSPRPLKMVDIYVYQNSADRNGTVVKRLENWAREENFGVSFPPVQNETRPE